MRDEMAETPMTPDQFSAAWDALDLSASEMARLLGLNSGRIIREYAAGTKTPSNITLTLLALRLADDGLDPAAYGLPDPAETSAEALRR